VRRSKLGLATGLGLGLLGYAALVRRSRRTLVSDPPLGDLEAALKEWLAEAGLTAIDRYVHTPVGRVHVLLAGQGDSTVVVLAGLGASAGDFAELLARLARQHRVVAIDLPGSGLSDPIRFPGHPRRPWDQVITAVADQLGLSEFNLVGHSLGGLAAGGFAIDHPNRVRQLVLISPLGFSRRVPLLWNLSMVPGTMDLRGLYERAMLRRRLEEPGDRDGRSGHRGEWGVARDLYRRRTGFRFGHGSDLDLVGRLLQPLGLRPESRLLPALGLLSGRVLVLWGSEDRRMPLPDAQAEIQYFKGIRLEVVPGLGHLLPVHRPDVAAQLITDFLGDLPS